MVKLTTVVDGQEIVIESTVEEIKAFQDENMNSDKESNVNSDLLSPKERLDTDKSHKFKAGDIVRFTDNANVKLSVVSFLGLFDNGKIEEGEYGYITESADEGDNRLAVLLENRYVVAILSDVEDILEKVSDEIEENPLDLKEDKEYFVKSYNGDYYNETVTLVGVDNISYLFEKEDGDTLYVLYRLLDTLELSNEQKENSNGYYIVKNNGNNPEHIFNDNVVVYKLSTNSDDGLSLYSSSVGTSQIINDGDLIPLTSNADYHIDKFKQHNKTPYVIDVNQEEHEDEDDDLEVGEYYNVLFIHCDYSGDTLSVKVKLKEIDEDGDYVFINEDDTTSCIIKPENLDHYIFDELEENEESEENQKKFERGNIVEVLDEVGGVEEGNYGIVLGYDSDGDVNLAGFDEAGSFSTMWFHEEDDLRLIRK